MMKMEAISTSQNDLWESRALISLALNQKVHDFIYLKKTIISSAMHPYNCIETKCKNRKTEMKLRCDFR